MASSGREGPGERVGAGPFLGKQAGPHDGLRHGGGRRAVPFILGEENEGNDVRPC
jgi:hypothetical protein